MNKIILATESPFKRQLFDRLRLSYTAVKPQIDETPQADEHAKALSLRLAKEKAAATGRPLNNALIIGCDQAPVTSCGRILSKPGTPEKAIEELKRLSGETVIFYTAVAVLTYDDSTGQETFACHIDETRVTYKSLQAEQIERYIEKEAAWQCAGAVQSESLGISLLSSIETRDPTALVGLPLIGLIGLLNRAGIDLP